MFSSTSSSILPIRNISEALQRFFNNKEIPKQNEEQILRTMELFRDDPDAGFSYLREQFAEYFDINLLIIAFRHGKFLLISMSNHGKSYMSCLVFDERNTLHGILFIMIENDVSLACIQTSSIFVQKT